MKDLIFSLLWAAICAWAFTKILIWADLQFELGTISILAWILDLLHKWGLSIKKVVFFAFLALFLLTGMINNKYGWREGIASAVGAGPRASPKQDCNRTFFTRMTMN